MIYSEGMLLKIGWKGWQILIRHRDAVSYLVVQVFEPVTANRHANDSELELQPKTGRMSLLQTYEFAFLPLCCFLIMLNATPTPLNLNSESESAGFTVTLSEADCTLSKGWTEPDCLSQITSTMKEFTKRKSGKDVDAIDEY